MMVVVVVLVVLMIMIFIVVLVVYAHLVPPRIENTSFNFNRIIYLMQ